MNHEIEKLKRIEALRGQIFDALGSVVDFSAGDLYEWEEAFRVGSWKSALARRMPITDSLRAMMFRDSEIMAGLMYNPALQESDWRAAFDQAVGLAGWKVSPGEEGMDPHEVFAMRWQKLLLEADDPTKQVVPMPYHWRLQGTLVRYVAIRDLISEAEIKSLWKGLSKEADRIEFLKHFLESESKKTRLWLLRDFIETATKDELEDYGEIGGVVRGPRAQRVYFEGVLERKKDMKRNVFSELVEDALYGESLWKGSAAPTWDKFLEHTNFEMVQRVIEHLVDVEPRNDLLLSRIEKAVVRAAELDERVFRGLANRWDPIVWRYVPGPLVAKLMAESDRDFRMKLFGMIKGRKIAGVEDTQATPGTRTQG